MEKIFKHKAATLQFNQFGGCFFLDVFDDVLFDFGVKDADEFRYDRNGYLILQTSYGELKWNVKNNK